MGVRYLFLSRLSSASAAQVRICTPSTRQYSWVAPSARRPFHFDLCRRAESEAYAGGKANDIGNESDEEEEFEEPPHNEFIAEEERLTAQYLATLDSQWTEDPPNHRSGAEQDLAGIFVYFSNGKSTDLSLYHSQVSSQSWVVQMRERAPLSTAWLVRSYR